MTHPGTKTAFIEPMLLLRKEKLPEGPNWLYEVKLDGYRALAIKTGKKVQIRLRNDNDFNQRYPGIVEAHVRGHALKRTILGCHCLAKKTMMPLSRP